MYVWVFFQITHYPCMCECACVCVLVTLPSNNLNFHFDYNKVLILFTVNSYSLYFCENVCMCVCIIFVMLTFIAALTSLKMQKYHQYIKYYSATLGRRIVNWNSQ